MIGRVRGFIVDRDDNRIVIDVGGVGYEIEIPTTILVNLPPVNDEVVLHTHMVVRDDQHQLYGFIAKRERDLFRTLIKVNGVGPKLGLVILSGCDAPGLAAIVKDNDFKSLVALPGVGKKTAERLIVELRDRLDEWADERSVIGRRVDAAAPAMLDEAESALISLGFRPQEAAMAIAQVGEDAESLQEVIKQALRSLGRQG